MKYLGVRFVVFIICNLINFKKWDICRYSFFFGKLNKIKNPKHKL